MGISRHCAVCARDHPRHKRSKFRPILFLISFLHLPLNQFFQVPFTHASIIATSLDSGKKGISVVLEAAGGNQNPENKPNQNPHAFDFPEVIKAALGILHVIAGLSREKESLKHVWKSIRANSGIKILLSLLRIKEPASHAGDLYLPLKYLQRN